MAWLLFMPLMLDELNKSGKRQPTTYQTEVRDMLDILPTKEESNPVSTITDRINHRLTVTDHKPIELAKATGLSRGNISLWTRGGVVNLKPENLVSAADFLRCEIRWLAVGEGEEERQPLLADDQREVVRIMAKLPTWLRFAIV